MSRIMKNPRIERLTLCIQSISQKVFVKPNCLYVYVPLLSLISRKNYSPLIEKHWKFSVRILFTGKKLFFFPEIADHAFEVVKQNSKFLFTVCIFCLLPDRFHGSNLRLLASTCFHSDHVHCTMYNVDFFKNIVHWLHWLQSVSLLYIQKKKQRK